MEIHQTEKFYRQGKDHVIMVVNDGEVLRGEIYALEGVYKGLKDEEVNDILTKCKQIIDNK